MRAAKDIKVRDCNVFSRGNEFFAKKGMLSLLGIATRDNPASTISCRQTIWEGIHNFEAHKATPAGNIRLTARTPWKSCNIRSELMHSRVAARTRRSTLRADWYLYLKRPETTASWHASSPKKLVHVAEGYPSEVGVEACLTSNNFEAPTASRINIVHRGTFSGSFSRDSGLRGFKVGGAPFGAVGEYFTFDFLPFEGMIRKTFKLEASVGVSFNEFAVEKK